MKHAMGCLLLFIPITYVLFVVIDILIKVIKLILETCLGPLIIFTLLTVMTCVGLYLLR
jgi:hypothetical protein